MKKERLYTVRMRYDITLSARSEADAIHTAHYLSIAGHEEEVSHLSQEVICVNDVPEPAPEPEIMPEVQAGPYPGSVHDAAAGEQLAADSNSSTYRDPAPASDIPF